MAKNEKMSLLKLITKFFSILYKRVETTAGVVNISFGIFIVFVIFLTLFQPIIFYILQMVQSLFNAVLSYFNRQPIQVADTTDTLPVLIISLIILFIESITCTILVHWSDIKKLAAKKDS